MTKSHAIKTLIREDLPQFAPIIRKSFATVAEEFGWTQEVAPTFTAYITDEKLRDKCTEDCTLFGLFVEEMPVGFVSLTDQGAGIFELQHLSVLPEWRHCGYGKLLLDHCKACVKAAGGNKITLSLVEENTRLKTWYLAHGFTRTGTKKFPWHPFTVGFMQWMPTP